MEYYYNLFKESNGICTDSRSVISQSLFICLKGTNFDGNTFALEAINKGAKYVITSDQSKADNHSIFYVDDTLKFLQNLANYHRKQFNIPIIGITGSNGKTTSKELISTVLQKKYKVHYTKGNLNNHIGVPLTLLQLNASHELAVIEMGANKFEDIKELCDIAEPNYGIITNIGKAHLEGFINFEGVLKTKKELYDHIEIKSGTIIVNLDDEVLLKQTPLGVNTFTYGSEQIANIQGKLVELTPFVNFNWTDKTYTSPNLLTHLVGKYNFYNFLAAVAFGKLFNVDNEAINEALVNYVPTNNRSQVTKTENNTLILDCYNANPSSMKSALESFSQINQEHKLIIIGDMLELGSDSTIEHKKIIALAEELNLKGYTVGPIFKQLESNVTTNFENTSELISFLTKNQQKDQLILLKGSRGIGLEVLQNYL